MSIFRQLIDPKVIKILDLFLKNKDKLFHLNKISEEAKVSIASTFRIISKLVSLNLLDVVVIGKMKIYKIADNEKVREIESVLIKNERKE